MDYCGSNSVIYLDACATTPVHPEVINEINHVQSKYWGNPSSIHKIGIMSAEILERARYNISIKFKCSLDEIIFTSGATESVNLAIRGLASNIKPGRLIISSVEHPSVLAVADNLKYSGWDIQFWDVDNNGQLNMDNLDFYLSPPTKIVSIIWGQSEIGTIQPIQTVGAECKKRGIYFHTDATQILPHGIINWNTINCDLLSASAHKLQGPKGIGLLLYKSSVKKQLSAIHGGGPQQFGLRSGTEPVALISGFSKALEFIKNDIILKDNITIFPSSNVNSMTTKLGDKLTSNIQLTLTGHKSERLPNHLSYLLSGIHLKPINGRRFVHELSKRGIYVSSGSACKSGNTENNLVLSSINVKNEFQKSALRLSLGSWIDPVHIDYIAETISETLTSL